MRTGHTTVRTGKKVMVHLLDGHKIIGKFLRKEHSHVFLEGQEPIKVKDIRTVSYYKENTR